MYVLIDDMFPLRSLIMFSSEETSGGACKVAVSVGSVLLEKAPLEDSARNRIKKIVMSIFKISKLFALYYSAGYKTSFELGLRRTMTISPPVRACPVGQQAKHDYTSCHAMVTTS